MMMMIMMMMMMVMVSCVRMCGTAGRYRLGSGQLVPHAWCSSTLRSTYCDWTPSCGRWQLAPIGPLVWAASFASIPGNRSVSLFAALSVGTVACLTSQARDAPTCTGRLQAVISGGSN